MVIGLLFLLSLPLSLIWPQAGIWLALILALALIATSIPFEAWAVSKDPMAALLGLLLIPPRTLAFMAGLATGILKQAFGGLK